MKCSTATSSVFISVPVILFITVFFFSLTLVAPVEENAITVTFEEYPSLDHVCFTIEIDNNQDFDDSFPLKPFLNRTNTDIGKVDSKLWEWVPYEYEKRHCNTCETELMDCTTNNETNEEICTSFNITITDCGLCGLWKEKKTGGKWIEKTLTNTERTIISEERTIEKVYEKNELRNRFESIQIKKQENKRFKLCYYFNEIPRNPTTGKPGSYGFMYLNIKDSIYHDFYNSSWWNYSYAYKMAIVANTTSGSVTMPILINDTAWYNGSTPQHVWCNLLVNTSRRTVGYLYFNDETDYRCTNSNDDTEVAMDVDEGNGTNVGDPWDINAIGVWHLGDCSGTTCLDKSLYGNDGTKKASGEPANTTGWIAGAQDFDGDDFINLSYIPAASGNEVTVMAWIYPDTDATGTIVSLDGSSVPRVSVATVTGSNSLVNIAVNMEAEGDGRLYDNCNETLAINQWHHVAFSYKNGSFHRVYVNGTLYCWLDDTEDPVPTGSIGVPTSSAYIGSMVGAGYFRGIIDDVRIFNRSLDGDEILASYNNTFGTHNFSQLGSVENYKPVPQITIYSPQNIIYYTTNIDLNWTSDMVVDWAAYSLNGNNNVSLESECENGHTDNNDGTCTVKLQSADTENMADIGAGDSNNRDFQIKWNISTIPALNKRAIKGAVLCIYWSYIENNPDTDVNISRILSQSWTESISAGEWNAMQFDISSITNFDSVTKETWGCVNVTDIFAADYIEDHDYSTIRLLDPDYTPGAIINIYDDATLPIGSIAPYDILAAEDKENSNGTGNLPYLNITYYKTFNTTITTQTSPNNITVCANSTTGTLNCSTVQFSVKMNITFNITSGEDGSSLNNVNVYCTDLWSDTINSSHTRAFHYGFDYNCVFDKLGPPTDYYNKTVVFTADDNKTVDVIMSEWAYLTIEEHDWLGSIYKCLFEGDCLAINLLLNINETTSKTWNQFKRTDQSIVTKEMIISSTVNSTSNLTINYTINVPTKEGYGLIDGIQGYDDFLPIRISYWFLDSTNISCYSQGNYTVATIEPYCQPLIAYTVGQINTQINFSVEMRPNLPAGTYNIVRNIEIDPKNVWIDYGQEIISSIIVLEDSKEAGAKITSSGDPALDEMKESEKSVTVVTEHKIDEQPNVKESDVITGLTTENAFDPTYLSVIVSMVTFVIVVFIYRDSKRKKTPWGY